MEHLKIRNIILAKGKPKICVPIIGKTKKEVLEQVLVAKEQPFDILEWRADFLETKITLDILEELRVIIENKPIIFTFRTFEEGGNSKITKQEYININKEVMASNFVDLIDIEFNLGELVINELVEFSKSKNMLTIGSYHNFKKTPEFKELLDIYKNINEKDVDIVKIAVMPENKKDVLTLLSASLELYENVAKKPFIIMSMSQIGLVSRVFPEVFGSSVSFASIGKASAAGQIELNKLRFMIDTINESIEKEKI